MQTPRQQVDWAAQRKCQHCNANTAARANRTRVCRMGLIICQTTHSSANPAREVNQQDQRFLPVAVQQATSWEREAA
jgi:hypothetical protein